MARLLGSRRIREYGVISTAILLLFAPVPAAAGPIGVVSALITATYVYVAVVIVVSIAALMACRWIRNPRLRIFVRLLIVVFLYTPVPLVVAYDTTRTAPAFLSVFGSILTGSNYGPHHGVMSHPFALAYGLAVLLSLPVVIAWTHLRERHLRIRAASHAQPPSTTASTARDVPPT
jgi:hypothetical protein